MMNGSVIVEGKVTWLARREIRTGFREISIWKGKRGKVVTRMDMPDL